MARVLMPLPERDFDPTEAAIPWRVLTARGHDVRFATPSGKPANADSLTLTGRGLGIWRPLLRADRDACNAYAAMSSSPAFQAPLRYAELRASDYDGVLLPGGHAPGMREYIESPLLHTLLAEAFARKLQVGAICHGVLVLARARCSDGRSLLNGRRTTALTRLLEISGWALTAPWLGRHYRTYPQTVEQEVIAALAKPEDYLSGPLPLLRDADGHLERGFIVRDGHYLSARWPGDARRFANEFVEMVEAAVAMHSPPVAKRA